MGEYLKNKALLYRNFCVRNIIKILERAIMDVLSRKLGIDLSPSTNLVPRAFPLIGEIALGSAGTF